MLVASDGCSARSDGRKRPCRPVRQARRPSRGVLQALFPFLLEGGALPREALAVSRCWASSGLRRWTWRQVGPRGPVLPAGGQNAGRARSPGRSRPGGDRGRPGRSLLRNNLNTSPDEVGGAVPRSRCSGRPMLRRAASRVWATSPPSRVFHPSRRDKSDQSDPWRRGSGTMCHFQSRDPKRDFLGGSLWSRRSSIVGHTLLRGGAKNGTQSGCLLEVRRAERWKS